MAHSSRLHHITKQWSSHEGTVEYFPNKLDVTQSRRYSQSTRSISKLTTAILQLEHSSNPIQYRGDWKNTRNSCFGFVKDDIKQMNHYRHVRVIERSDIAKDSSKVHGEFDLNYHQNDHRFYSAYNQRLTGGHNPRLSFKESSVATGELNTRFASQRLSTYQNDTSLNLTVTDFVNQRYRSPKKIEVSPLLKQNSWESASTNSQFDTMKSSNKSRNLQIDQMKRQKSCEINTYFDSSSTYRPIQEPYSRSHRDSHSSSRKQSFQNTYGNSEVSIGIEHLSIESATSTDYENTNKESECQDFLSVNRYANRMSLSKQRSCESPPVISEEFSYAQKYKIANYRQKSCDSPTNVEDNYWKQLSNKQNNERRSSSYCEGKYMIKNEKLSNDSSQLRFASNLGASHSNLINTQPQIDTRRQSFVKSSPKKKLLNRQPSMDLRDHRSSENPYVFTEDSQSFREKNSDSVNNLDYLSPTRYGGTYSRTPITKQRSCEIAIDTQIDDNKPPLKKNVFYSQRPSSSNYNYHIRSSFENMKQPETSLYGNKLNFYPDPLVSTSSTDLRHLRKNTMIYSTGADNFLSQNDTYSDINPKTSKRQSIRTSADGHNQHLDVPITGSKLTKQSSYDVSSSRRICSSNSNSPSKSKASISSPASDKLSKQHRKFSHDSQSHRKSIKSDKSIWSQAILSLKKKRAIFFGKRSKTRSTEKNNVDPVYHFLKCTANIDHNPDICECPCHALPHPEILFHAHSSVNLPAIAYKSKHK